MKICLILFVLLLSVCPVDAMTWWNTSWNYSINNPIMNGSRPYQLSLNISNTTGTNNATHVFCNGHCNVNFTDIRFTLDNVSTLPYWIENNITGEVWVNVTANGTVNMYYGNPSAASVSGGINTFSFFDDFNDGDYNGWAVAAGEWSASDYTLKMTTNASWAGVSQKSIKPQIYEGRFRIPDNVGAAVTFGASDAAGNSNGYFIHISHENMSSLYRLQAGVAWILLISSSWVWDEGWHKVTLVRSDVGNWKMYLDGVQKGTSVTDTIYTGLTYFNIRTQSTAIKNTSFDDIRIRSYTSQEPVWLVWGTEQNTMPPEIVSNSTSRIFELVVDKPSDIEWQLGGVVIQTNLSVTGARYTNNTTSVGLYNITATASFAGGSNSITWIWNIYQPGAGEAVREFVQVIIS